MKSNQKISWKLQTASSTGETQETFGAILWTHQLIVSGVGSVTATAIVEGTNDPSGSSGWQTIVTLSASGSGVGQDSAVVQHSWAKIRAKTTAMTGSGVSAVVNTSGA